MYAEEREYSYNEVLTPTGKEKQYFDRLHSEKYRDKNQNKEDHNWKLARNLASTNEHAYALENIFRNNRFLPAGRVQAALGAQEREVSPFNCSVSQKIEDNIDSIFHALHRAAKILRLGTGIGYNFSHLRPKGALVRALQTEASGPVSYMRVFNEMAATIASSGHRRGAQMGILNVDHPDIETFIDAKMEPGALRQFNVSVGITEDFMYCLNNDIMWELQFEGKVSDKVHPRYLWNKMLRNAYDSAEPGVVFLDSMNDWNNLYYCEEIEATNPCSEQPLPAYGLCTLGSFNLTRYLISPDDEGYIQFDFSQFESDICAIVEAYDNIFDNAVYAIPEHREEALKKRRIGLGLTGIANAIEMMVGKASYGEPRFNELLDSISERLAHTAYRASIDLVRNGRKPFDLFDADKYTESRFIKTLPEDIQRDIKTVGIRNSHLISYAPCGTISQCAGNISSGIEPVFYHAVDRDVHMRDGKEKITIKDWAYREHGFKGKTLEQCSVEDHLSVAQICQKYCDSAVSKTINVAPNCSYQEYESIYRQAYDLGLKGITVYRPTPLRGAVIVKSEQEEAKNTSEFNTATCASGACER